MANPTFDRIAKYYDQLARLVFGKAIIDSQTVFLDKISTASNVLVLGGGTGWWLNYYLKKNPNTKILYIDSSSEMIALAKKKTPDHKRIDFRLGTEDSINATNKFDVVITYYFLDVFSETQLNNVITTIKETLKPNAYWLVSDFVDQKWWHTTMLFLMYRFFRLVTKLKNQKLPDWNALLLENDLVQVEGKMFYGSFIRSVLYRRK